MKKLVGVPIITIIILAIVSALLYSKLSDLQNQNIELRNRNSQLEDQLDKVTNRVNITEFSISGFRSWEGLIIYESNVNVKIHNFGINNVEGLTLVIVGFGDERLAERLQIDILHVGEEQEISTHAYWAYGSAGTSIATLRLGDMILDEYSLLFSSVYPKTG